MARPARFGATRGGASGGISWQSTRLSNGMVWSLALDSAGTLYAGTNGAGAQVSRDRWRRWGPTSGKRRRLPLHARRPDRRPGGTRRRRRHRELVAESGDHALSARRRAVIAPPKPLPITITSKDVDMMPAQSASLQRRTRISLTLTELDGSAVSERDSSLATVVTICGDCMWLEHGGERDYVRGSWPPE